MTPFEAFSLLACPPPSSRLTTWAEIHRDLQTPPGSDATMREWAMQRMRDITGRCDCGRIEHGRHHMDCPANKPATLTQEGPEGKTTQQPAQPPQSDTGAIQAALRADLAQCVAVLRTSVQWQDIDFAETMAKKWALV